MKTTLNKIRKHKPCTAGWAKLLKNLGKTRADDEELSLVTILESNGLGDALWCLRAVEGKDKEIRLYGVWCARQVMHLMTDPRSINALDVSERYANGDATSEELTSADVAAAAAAALAATRSAAAAARSAAWATYAAAESAAYTAAYATESAAWAYAKSATSAYAAESAAWAYSKSATSGDVTWDDAWSAARSTQEKKLREVCADSTII